MPGYWSASAGRASQRREHLGREAGHGVVDLSASNTRMVEANAQLEGPSAGENRRQCPRLALAAQRLTPDSGTVALFTVLLNGDVPDSGTEPFSRQDTAMPTLAFT